jgi:hypothetical protein
MGKHSLPGGFSLSASLPASRPCFAEVRFAPHLVRSSAKLSYLSGVSLAGNEDQALHLPSSLGTITPVQLIDFRSPLLRWTLLWCGQGQGDLESEAI